jgi:hypothetical protein
MRAFRQREFGPPAVLRYETVLDPVPAAGQARWRLMMRSP